MVKLVSVRATRMYGPRDSEAACEFANAFSYLVATILILSGFVLMLPGFDHKVGLIVFAVALALILLVNLHDMYAQLAGVDYRFGLLASDPQLALVEFGAPLVHTIGAILFLIAVVFMLQSKSLLGFGGGRQLAAMRLLVAGAVFWFLGSFHNACQVYERTGLLLQLCQKAVYLPFLLASTLYLISSILWLRAWPAFVILRKAQYGAVTMAIVASILLILGALANISRVGYLRRLAAQEGSPRIDSLRGARERLEMERSEHARPLLHEQPGVRVPAPTPTTGALGEVVEDPHTYREAVLR